MNCIPSEKPQLTSWENCAYLINTTPKYFYLLPLHITLLHRYAANLKWPIYIATESPELLPELEGVSIIHLPMTKAAFLDSRSEAVKLLPPNIRYVFPIQEDFLLEGRPMLGPIENAFEILTTHPEVSSLRLMPCPGPKGDYYMNTEWKQLDYDIDSLVFTYQATIWRRERYIEFIDCLIAAIPSAYQNKYAIKINIAENSEGQAILKSFGNVHLAWPREGTHPNAVYLCPWPYRPTAVVRGLFESWANELAKREGFSNLYYQE